MNYIEKLIAFIAAIILALCLQTANGQDIDTNRMNRDINVMESVLQEMFKTRWTAHGDTVVHQNRLFNFPTWNNEKIWGTYLPDYGVIFTIAGGRPPSFIAYGRSGGDDFSHTFLYGESQADEKVTEESITNNIVEFLQDYGSTIKQLSPDDKITVIYRSQGFDQRVTLLSPLRDSKELEYSALPTISVTVNSNDLKTYRSDDITADELQERLDIIKTQNNNRDQTDLKVMATIFETGFEEQTKKAFRITGSVDYQYLDNFGVLFFCKAVPGQSLASGFSSISHSLNQSDFNSVSLSKGGNVIVSTKNGKKTLYDHKGKKVGEESKKQHEQYKKQLHESYQQFIAELKKYIVDYGRTLKSVESNQQVLVSVSPRGPGIPERVDLTIQKSTLEAVDKGSMTLEQAINQIDVREY